MRQILSLKGYWILSIVVGLGAAAIYFQYDFAIQRQQATSAFLYGQKTTARDIDSACERWPSNLKFFCREGFYFQQHLQSDLKKSIPPARPDDSVVWAVTLGMSQSRLGRSLAQARARVKDQSVAIQYVTEGWAFDHSLIHGPRKTLSECQSSLDLTDISICEWAIGRARFFSPHPIVRVESPISEDGFSFARYFTHTSRMPILLAGSKFGEDVAHVLRTLQWDGKQDLKGRHRKLADCMAQKHVSKCRE